MSSYYVGSILSAPFFSIELWPGPVAVHALAGRVKQHSTEASLMHHHESDDMSSGHAPQQERTVACDSHVYSNTS